MMKTTSYALDPHGAPLTVPDVRPFDTDTIG